MSPLVSVIVPVYNVEKYLSRCIESILGQTYKNFELILVDDGSSDNSGKICDEWETKDNRITVFHEENQGQSAARNYGIDYAFNTKSKWIMFVDSDDWIHKKMLEIFLKAATKYSVPIVCCDYIETQCELLEDIIDDNAKIIPTSEFYLNKNIAATVPWAKLYKTECFRNIRYPVGKIHEDEFVTYKILFACDKIAYIDAPMYAYYQNPNSITHVWSDKRLAALDALDEQIDFFITIIMTVLL